MFIVYLKNAEAAQRRGDAARRAIAATREHVPRQRRDAMAPAGIAAQALRRPRRHLGAARRRSSALGSRRPLAAGMIQADPATNSLIITAPEPLYRNLRAVIDQLDARRAQVSSRR